MVDFSHKDARNLSLLQKEFNQLPPETDFGRTHPDVFELRWFAVAPALKCFAAGAKQRANFVGRHQRVPVENIRRGLSLNSLLLRKLSCIPINLKQGDRLQCREVG